VEGRKIEAEDGNLKEPGPRAILGHYGGALQCSRPRGGVPLPGDFAGSRLAISVASVLVPSRWVEGTVIMAAWSMATAQSEKRQWTRRPSWII